MDKYTAGTDLLQRNLTRLGDLLHWNLALRHLLWNLLGLLLDLLRGSPMWEDTT